MRPAPAHPPKSAILIRPDALGDLVLFSPTLRAIRAGWPEARLGVVVRRSLVELGALLVPDVEWIGTSIDPYVTGPGEQPEELRRLRALIAERAPALVVAACARRTWLDAALAQAAPNSRRVAFVTAAPDPYYEVPLNFELEADTVSAFPEILPALPADEDWKRNFGLASALLGRPVKPVRPKLDLPPARLAEADGVFVRAGFTPGRVVTCAGAGFANVFLKTWPPERFAEAIARVHAATGRRTLLVGHATEHDYLARIARAAGESASGVWTGGEGELALLAAIVARAEVHFGNDTGTLHLAAALGVPTVTVFGGGTWPRFVPASNAAISIVHPLPCFGCGWDCAFGDAPCVKLVDTGSVVEAVTSALSAPPVASRIVTLDAVAPETAAVMAQAAGVARERATAHLERQRKLLEIGYLSGQKEPEIRALKSAADEKDREIEALKRATDEKDAQIRSLKAATDEKDREIVKITAAAEERRLGMQRNQKAAQERLEKMVQLDRVVSDLKRVAEDRRRAQEELHRSCAELREAAEERRRKLEEVSRVCAELKRVCDEREAMIKQLSRRLHQLEGERTQSAG